MTAKVMLVLSTWKVFSLSITLLVTLETDGDSFILNQTAH